MTNRPVLRLFSSMSLTAEESAKKIAGLDEWNPNWRKLRHANGRRQFADNGIMLNDDGTRSIFCDLDD